MALCARSLSVPVTMVTSVKDIHSQMLSITYRMCSKTAWLGWKGCIIMGGGGGGGAGGGPAGSRADVMGGGGGIGIDGGGTMDVCVVCW